MKRISILVLTFFVYKIVLCQKYDSIPKSPAITIQRTDREIRLRRDIADFGNYDKSIGQIFGEFSAKDISGKNISTKDLAGKITFINFSFSSCLPCHYVYEKLNQLYSHYKADTNFQLISFTFDNIDEAKRTILQYSLLYRIISTTHELCTSLIFRHGYPSNFLLDEKCRVTFGHTGVGESGTNADPFRDKIIPRIDSLLLSLKFQRKPF